MTKENDPAKPDQVPVKPGSGSGTDTGTDTGSGTKTGAGSGGGVAPMDNEKPPQTRNVLVAATESAD